MHTKQFFRKLRFNMHHHQTHVQPISIPPPAPGSEPPQALSRQTSTSSTTTAGQKPQTSRPPSRVPEAKSPQPKVQPPKKEAPKLQPKLLVHATESKPVIQTGTIGKTERQSSIVAVVVQKAKVPNPVAETGNRQQSSVMGHDQHPHPDHHHKMGDLGHKVKGYANERYLTYKEIFGDVFSCNTISMAFRGVRRFCCRRRAMAPLSKRIHWRLLALEPLCCIDSMRIRGGCTSAAIFQMMAIAAMTSSSILKILTQVMNVQDPSSSVIPSGSSSLGVTFTRIVDHPIAYGLLLLFNVLWAFSVFFLMLGIKNFDANIIRPHIAAQVFSVLVCLLVAGAQAVRFITVHDWGSVEELAIVISSVFAITVQIWSITVVYDCMKYFRMCETLVDVARTKRGFGTGGGVSVTKRAAETPAATELAVISIAQAAVNAGHQM